MTTSLHAFYTQVTSKCLFEAPGFFVPGSLKKCVMLLYDEFFNFLRQKRQS